MEFHFDAMLCSNSHSGIKILMQALYYMFIHPTSDACGDGSKPMI